YSTEFSASIFNTLLTASFVAIQTNPFLNRSCFEPAGPIDRLPAQRNTAWTAPPAGVVRPG
ncbi:MAG TPA: hypothetical protein PLD10_01285, partial [Rhodopila sp.]|nr:hypothetical protein [Rhodopila sp.]